MTDLDRKMPNGASVSDWIGTAMNAAQVAASRLETARSIPVILATETRDEFLASAEGYLVQALAELHDVQNQLARDRIDRFAEATA
jgi:hypothetical protein